MNIRYRKPKYLVVLIPFAVLLLFGLLSIAACHGECGASNHGGWLHYVCQKVYVSLEVTNLCIIFGSLGTITGILMLTYRLIHIYEAEFTANGISAKKEKNNLLINFSAIIEMDYNKPSVFNYLTLWGGGLLPGILLIRIKVEGGKQKAYFIRLKYKDFERLPKKYKDLIK
jgi:hypothetical protein